MMTVRASLVPALVTAVLILAGCAGQAQREAPPTVDESADPYRIGVGDTIAIHVWRNPELTQTIVVRPDGYVSMPLMGDLKADGRRPEELAETINRALSQVIRSPEVAVMVTNPASAEYLNRVRVTGQVANPLSIPFKQGMTVLDLVLQAGGVTDFGAGDRATLQRLVEGQYESFRIELDAILNEGNMATNYQLQPGDLISVPKKRLLRGEL